MPTLHSATPDSQLLPVTLTDSPRVVELKREFYVLDLREEELKLETVRLRQRKAAIAGEIFQSR